MLALLFAIISYLLKNISLFIALIGAISGSIILFILPFLIDKKHNSELYEEEKYDWYIILFIYI